MKKHSFLNIILILTFGIAFLWLAKDLLFPANYFIIRINGGDHMYMNGSYGYGAGIFSASLVFLIKLLIVVFVVALIVGLIMAAKNYLFTPQDFAAFKGDFYQAPKPKKICSNCGKTLEEEWKVCPYCAAEVNKNEGR